MLTVGATCGFGLGDILAGYPVTGVLLLVIAAINATLVDWGNE